MKKRLIVLSVLFAIASASWSSTIADSRPAFSGVYHEASCPSVDRSRMQRMKRDAAEAAGLLPAPDCHPTVSVRYLGMCCPPSEAPSTETAATIQVRGYTRADGTHVDGYERARPQHVNGYTRADGTRAQTQHVNGYTRADGTRVEGYDRSPPTPRD